MKKSFLITAVITVLCSSLLFAGCGSKKTESTQATTGLTVETTQQKGFEIESTAKHNEPTVKPADPVDVPRETDEKTQATTNSVDTTKATNANNATKATTDVQTTTVALISKGEAQRIALDHAGVTERQSTPKKVELDVENGKQIYEIDFLAGNMEYEYEINAETGAIISADKEPILE